MPSPEHRVDDYGPFNVTRGIFVDEARLILGPLASAPEELWVPLPDAPGIDSTGFFNSDLRPADEARRDLFLDLPSELRARLQRFSWQGIFRRPDFLQVNRQAPGAKQQLHTDRGTKGIVHVVQFSPEGMFNYKMPDAPADEELQSAPVGMGDLVTLHWQISHGGENPSERTRYNMVLGHRG